MAYNLIGILNTSEKARITCEKLKSEGFIKEFLGFYENVHFQPESLVEDHYRDDSEIHLFTPNLNRAYKAQNILLRMDANMKKGVGKTKVPKQLRYVQLKYLPYLKDKEKVHTRCL